MTSSRAVAGAVPKRRAAPDSADDSRPPPWMRAALRRAPHGICVALLQETPEARVSQLEEWISDRYSDRLTTKESVLGAVRWAHANRSEILAEALEDRKFLQSKVDCYDDRLRFAIDQLEKSFAAVSKPLQE